MITGFAETVKTWRELVAGFKSDIRSDGDAPHESALGDFMQV